MKKKTIEADEADEADEDSMVMVEHKPTELPTDDACIESLKARGWVYTETIHGMSLVKIN